MSTTASTSIRIDRLEHLAEFLENGILGHKKFDIDKYNSRSDGRCGSAGCALGECPTLWPDDWMFRGEGISLRAFPHKHAENSAIAWFGVSIEEVHHLFYSHYQHPKLYGGEKLGGGATRYQVAANIRAFVQIVK